MRITNTFFKHKEIHKFTWEARGTKSIIDYTITNEKMWPNVIDTRVYRGAEIDSDHYLVKTKIRIPKKYIKKKEYKAETTEGKYKIQLLEEESVRKLYQQRLESKLKGRSGEINNDWEKLKTAVKKTAFEVLGTQRRRKINRLKIWNEELKEEITKKKASYRKWINTKRIEDHIEYKKCRAKTD